MVRSPGTLRTTAEPAGASVPARERFLSTDRYRAGREWKRYEGTAQRALFRELRERFLARNAVAADRVLDVGSGPGRFTAKLGVGPSTRRIALDLAREMLRELPDHWAGVASGEPLPDRVQGDAIQPPFLDHSFGLVAALGNLVGFAGEKSDRLLESLEGLLSPAGTLLLEVAPGSGERSRYLHRLPPTSVARLLRSSPRIVAARVAREGFFEEPRRRQSPGEFRRVDPALLRDRLEAGGFRVVEILSVAPAVGPDGVRAEAVAGDPKAWAHLLEVEEILGRSPERWTGAAAVMMAAIGPASPQDVPELLAPRSEG